MAIRQYRSFADFYPFYLGEHSRRGTRRLHFVGTLLVFGTLVYALGTRHWGALALLPVFGYGFAWVAHFAVEKNRPATFTHPLYSLVGDFRMFADILMGRIRF